jgi:hypothetical protein
MWNEIAKGKAWQSGHYVIIKDVYYHCDDYSVYFDGGIVESFRTLKLAQEWVSEDCREGGA